MRVAVLGDFHIPRLKPEMSEAAMDDVAESDPDLVVPLGDFGAPRKIGRPEGLTETYALLNRIDAPMRPILGNHDMEHESGFPRQRPGTMRRLFLNLFHLDEAYGVIEKDDVRFVFVSTDYQSPDICYQIQECYTSDRQFHAIERILNERRGVPVIMFSHAPPIGCGLRTVPNTHVRATNAFLSQNHEPGRWMDLAKRFPEIVMWFSAHYHLGHSHDDSVSYRHGTWFFTTGVHGNATRDGDRHTRLIDIDEDRVSVLTLCHEKRAVDDRYTWEHDGSLRTLIDRAAAKKDSVSNGDTSHIQQRVPVVGATPLTNVFDVLPNGNAVFPAEEGQVWEVHLEVESVIGSLLVEETPIDGLAAENGNVWIAKDNALYYVHADDMWRFIRRRAAGPRHIPMEFEERITAIATTGDGSVFVATGRKLSYVDVDAMQPFLLPPPGFEPNRKTDPVTEHTPSLEVKLQRDEFKADIRSIVVEDDRVVWLIDTRNDVWHYDRTTGECNHYLGGVVAWDVYERNRFGIVISDGEDTPGTPNAFERMTLIVQSSDESTFKIRLKDIPGLKRSAENVDVVGSKNGRVYLVVDGVVYLVEPSHSAVKLRSDGRVAALCRSDDGDLMYAAVHFPQSDRHSEVQTWRLLSVNERSGYDARTIE